MKKHRILSLILALVFIVSVFAACSDDDDSNDDDSNDDGGGSDSDDADSDASGGNSGDIEVYFDYVADEVTVGEIEWYRGNITTYTTPSTGTATKTTAADTIVFGSTANVQGAYPPENQQENQWCFNVYESLLQRNLTTGEYEPWLATGCEYDDDDNLHIYLREDVQFHDGNTMTAEDVLYTFNLSYENPRARAWTEMQKVDMENSYIVDDYHLVLVFHEHIASMMDLLASGYLSIMSKEFVEEVGPDYPYTEADAGTGPYYLTGMVQDVSMTFERFDDYWGGVPDGRVKNIIFRRYTDENVMFVDCITGQIDMLYSSRIQPYDIEQILDGTTTDVTLYRIPNHRNKALLFNLAEGSPTSDINVRRAISHAINYDEATIARYGSYAYAEDQLTSIFLDGVSYKVDIGKYEYDQELAKQYLAEAGYDTENRLTLNCLTTTSANNDELAELIQGYLAVIGIDLELDVVSSAAYRESTQALTSTSPYDFVVGSGAIGDFGNGSPVSILSGYLVYGLEEGQFNPLGAVYDQEVKELYDRAESSHDEDEIAECYEQIQQLFFDNVWRITMWADAQLAIAHSWIEGTTFFAGQNVQWSEWRIVE